jgi:hypothetical protein
MVEVTPVPVAVIEVKYCDVQPEGYEGLTPTAHCPNDLADKNRRITISEYIFFMVVH